MDGIPPCKLTGEQYQMLKLKRDPHGPLTALAGFGCSFGGKWWGGVARDRRATNFALDAHSLVLAKVRNIGIATPLVADFQSIRPTSGVVYLDPPYVQRTKA